MTHTLTDWRGRTIAPGATILYVRRVGSSVHLIEAEVREVFADAIVVQATATSGYSHAKGPSTLTALKNVTVLEEVTR